LTDADEEALNAHLDLLLAWNRKINLTAIRDFREAVRKHVGESLFLAGELPAAPLTVCDLGSGGGYPGIPVAIVRPNAQVSLIESDVRKSVFLREASRSLPNVRVLTARFETLANSFDWLVSRAVNLAEVKTGPVCRRAAVLGGASPGAIDNRQNAGLAARYRWSAISVPWENGGLLWLGEDVSRETWKSPPARHQT
jgi:16S rRNA (guanine527-N7)-methyltransferase